MPSSNITVVIPQKHPKYYLPGGDLHVIPAGGSLFRVHGYFFSRDSSMFRAKLNPASPGKVKEGTIDSPVMLDGVTDEEFEMLLWVFYNPKYSLYDADVDKWKSILHLAHKLDFKEVKSLAVRELYMKQELPLVEKMALYQNYQVDSRYLVPLFSELCSRDTPLTLEESKILGPESTCLVYTTRESLRAQASDGGRSPLPSGLEEKDVYREIETALEMDLGSTLAFQQSEEYAAVQERVNHNWRLSQALSHRGRGVNGGGVGSPKVRR